jgi:hypothetical protein
MNKLDQLKADYEKADQKAGQLTGEYENKRQKAISDLKDRYTPRLEKANQEALEAQQQYAAYEAAAALLKRGEDGESTLPNHTGPGGDRLRQAYEDLKNEQD